MIANRPKRTVWYFRKYLFCEVNQHLRWQKSHFCLTYLIQIASRNENPPSSIRFIGFRMLGTGYISKMRATISLLHSRLTKWNAKPFVLVELLSFDLIWLLKLSQTPPVKKKCRRSVSRSLIIYLKAYWFGSLILRSIGRAGRYRYKRRRLLEKMCYPALHSMSKKSFQRNSPIKKPGHHPHQWANHLNPEYHARSALIYSFEFPL